MAIHNILECATLEFGHHKNLLCAASLAGKHFEPTSDRNGNPELQGLTTSFHLRDHGRGNRLDRCFTRQRFQPRDQPLHVGAVCDDDPSQIGINSPELVEVSGSGYAEESTVPWPMLCSVDALQQAVSGPLEDRCGPEARTLTVEVHGAEVRGLAICPGRVMRYFFDSRKKRFRTTDLLRLMTAKRKPAA